MTSRGLLLIALFAIVVLLPTAASAVPGTVQGQVVNADTGEPLPFTNVVVEGTQFGAMTLEDGTFSLVLPEGTYNLFVTYMGYDNYTYENVVVTGEQTVELSLELRPNVALEMETLVVEIEGPTVDVKDSSVKKVKNADDLKAFAVDNVQEAMALEAGITMKGGELFVRGGRSGEVSTMIDGVPVNDPLGGAVSVSNVAIAEAEAVIGGMDAEYGNAQSAVFNITTREGGGEVEGTLRYTTDDYGRQDKTYTNYDRIAFGLGGPLLRDDFRWFLSGEGVWSDGENLTLDRRDEWSALGGFIKWKDRANRSFNLQNKITWRVSPKLKFNLETNANWSGNDPYIHNWNQEGYVDRLHLFERLELSGESIEGVEYFYYVARGTMPAKHGPWYEDYYLPNKRRQELGETTDFEKVLVKYKPSGAVAPIYEVVDAMRVKSAWTETEFLVLTDELFDGFMDTLSRWSYVRDDSSQSYFNSAEHTPSSSNFSNSVKFISIHNISEKVFYKLALTRLDFQRHRAVNDQEPWEYDTAGLPATLHNGATQRAIGDTSSE